MFQLVRLSVRVVFASLLVAIFSASVASAAPAAPVITSPTTGTTTNDNTPTISGTSGANATITIYKNNGVTAGTARADGSGAWTFTPSSPWADGIYSVTATAPNATGAVSAVSASLYFTCALTAQGGVKCWGNNHPDGGLGNGTTIDSLSPVDVKDLSSGVTAFDAGWAHTCAVIGGGVKCWGYNHDGGLGDGTTTAKSSPVDVKNLSSGVTAVDAGHSHTCAVTTQGGVKCWGLNGWGQLGDGTTTSKSSPVDVSGLTGVVAVSAGYLHTCALTTQGGVKCWGSNSNGELGDGTKTNKLSPVNVSGLSSGVVAVSAGANYTCAVTTGGGVKCWGYNGYGKLGDGTRIDKLSPANVVGVGGTGFLTGVVAVDTGNDHTCAVTTVGGVKCWGGNDFYRQLGDGTTNNSSSPVNVIGLSSGVTAVSAGGFHTCAVTTVGGVKCWGDNEWGQVGSASGQIGHGSVVVDVPNLTTGTSSESNTIILTIDTAAPAAPVITSPTTGTTTNDKTPTISGTSVANTTITIYKDGGSAGTATRNGLNWTFTPSSAWANGSHSVTAKARDAAGNTSSESNTIILTIDTAAPAAPVITSPTTGTVTNDKTPNISGTSVANTTITIYKDGGSAGTATRNGLNWTFTPSSAWADGTYSVTAKATDAAGNTSSESNIINLTIDTTAPAAPVITSPTTGTVTNDKTPTISGTSVANTTITIYKDGGSAGTATRNGLNWTFTPSSAWADGTYSVTAKATDAAGNTSSPSSAITLKIDTAAPAAPVITSPTTGTTTNDKTPIISGTSVANTTITIYKDGGSAGTATRNGLNWTFTPSSAWANGSHSVTAKARDAAGNTSSESNTIILTIDTAAPAAPVITSPTTGTTTNDKTPTISGTSVANTTITIYKDGGSAGTATRNGLNWTFTPSSAWADGTYSVTAKATDAAGNTSSPSGAITLTIDTTAPAAPVITSPTTGTVTNDKTPNISGTSVANTTITIYKDGGSAGTATRNGLNWTFTPSSAWADGTYSVTAKATDAAGNTSSPSSAITLKIDTAAPAAPVITSPTTGTTTKDNTPTISGTSVANTTITIYKDGGSAGTATRNGLNWTFTPSSAWANGSHSVTAKARDAAGNTSSESNTIILTIDTAAPVITSPTTGTTTNDNTPTISGTSVANTTITIYKDGGSAGTATRNGLNWTFTPSSAWADGSYSVTAKATDAAGNTSSESNTIILTIDTAAPAAPVITSPTTGTTTNDKTPTISGTSVANTTITIYKDGGSAGTATRNGLNWTFTPSSAWADGSHSVTAKARDAAGNTSSESNTIILTIDTAAPAAPVITSPTTGTTTNDNTPTISGTSVANTTITIYKDGGSAGTATRNGLNWTFTPSSAWADGSHSVTAKARDAAGNTSSESNTIILTIDTAAPAAPVITSPTTGTTTNDNTPTISGTSEANATITIYNGSAPAGTATANGSGNWTFTPSNAWADGSYSVTAKATDAAGNTSSKSVPPITLTVDTTVPGDTVAPAAPVITSPTTGTTINDNTPTISGTSEANATITIYNGSAPAGTATANNSGNWTFTPSNAWAEGSYSVTATATDAAHNTSPHSSPATTFALNIGSDRFNPASFPVIMTSNVTQNFAADLDSDQDGVSNAQEILDGTDPNDTGSVSPVLGTTLCSEWNGFFNMYNVLEHVNISNTDLNIGVKLYDINGAQTDSKQFELKSGLEFDALVHDMVGTPNLPGFDDDSYGLVCSSYEGSSGSLDGRMVYYKYNNNNVAEFAFAMPFSNPSSGEKVVQFNTYQPSTNTADANNLVANWIQIGNLSDTTQTGTLYFYGGDGATLKSEPVTISPHARRDIPAHTADNQHVVGIARWVPEDPMGKFTVRNVRYLYDNPGTSNSFSAAFQLEGQAGTGDLIVAPLDTTTSRSSSVVEVSNATGSTISVEVKIYDLNGLELNSQNVTLNAHATQHLVMDTILNGKSGIVTLDGNLANSVVATVMQYGRTTTGSIKFMYGIKAKQALGTVLKGTYNTFLNQGCQLLLANPGAAANNTTISMKRYDGSSPVVPYTVSVPAHGLKVEDICSKDRSNVYGVVTVEPSTTNPLYANMVRLGRNDRYRFSTEVRQ